MSVTYEDAREALARRLSQGSVDHSERVADTAASLADAYGVDRDSARLAGLLHDWDREMPKPLLVDRARELGMDVTDVDEAVPYLLHGPVGVAGVREALPGLSEDVLDAIGAHTFGSAGMSPLAKVLYIADSIEPARRHEGVEALRARVGHLSLDELFAEAYAASLRHLLDARKRIHPRTVATWNDIVGRPDA